VVKTQEKRKERLVSNRGDGGGFKGDGARRGIVEFFSVKRGALKKGKKVC